MAIDDIRFGLHRDLRDSVTGTLVGYGSASCADSVVRRKCSTCLRGALGPLVAAMHGRVPPRAAVLTAAATVVSLVPEDGDSAEIALRATLTARCATVRPFLSLLGRYSFIASIPAAGALRPLRAPDAPELDENDESAAD